MKILLDLLKDVYLFKKFTEEELRKIARFSHKKTYAPGDSIIYEGAIASSMYLIEFGSVKLLKKSKDQDQKIGVLGSGMHFGELPFIDNLERGLSVEVIEKSIIYEISYTELKNELDTDSKMAARFYFEVAHFLSIRLRNITFDLAFAREQNLKHF